MAVILWGVLGYLAGSIVWTLVLARAFGREAALQRVHRRAGEVDAHLVLKEEGDGNLAVLAAILDVLKGFVVVLIALLVAGPYEASAASIGAVAGHCWPPYGSRFAGRGLATAAGVFLALLPVEMVIAGVLIGLGHLARAGGIASSVGLFGIVLLAILRGQPAAQLVAAVIVVGLVLIRRLEGVGDDIAAGADRRRAVVRRALFDSSAPARPSRPPTG